MYVFQYDSLGGLDSMLLFHTLARMDIDALVIVSPAKPLISVGYFQDPREEVDLAYCKNEGLPVFRREVGGGAVYLDYNQIFYQVVVNRNHPLAFRDIQRVYREYSIVPVETYSQLGIKTQMKPVNDIVTEHGKKIAGEGAANIGNSLVFVGSIILDFNYEAMTKSLKVPEEKFRDKIYKTMRENLTTVKQETGSMPVREDVRKILIEKFENLFGKLTPAVINADILKKMRELESYYTSPAFMFKKTMRKFDSLKIRQGIEIVYGAHKAKGGLIKTAQEVGNRKINDIIISGDFTFYPKEKLDKLEKNLKGVKKYKDKIRERILEFYDNEDVQSPGVSEEDYEKAIKVEE